MNFSKYLYQVFLLSIFIPGLILAYLSFRTVKDERILIEKSLENRNEEFGAAIQNLVDKTRTEHLKKLQEQLQRANSSSGPDNYLFLATDLLENSMIQSLVIIRNDEMVFPRRLLYQDSNQSQDLMPVTGNQIVNNLNDFNSALPSASPAVQVNNQSTENLQSHTGVTGQSGIDGTASRSLASIMNGTHSDQSMELPTPAQEALSVIQSEYHQAKYLHTLKLIRGFNHAADTLYQTRAGALYRYGLWLLEIKCLIALNMAEEAVVQGRELITALLRGNGFSSYHQVRFYLTETVNTLMSMENLPHGIRDYFWSIHQKSEIFLMNAEYVSKEWNWNPETLIHSNSFDFQNPIQINVINGVPYLIIGYPWLDKETRVIARLNENIFHEAIETEMVQSKKSAWRDMDFSLLNQRDQMIMNTDSLLDRKVAMEVNLTSDFPNWKLIIYKKKNSEVIAIGRHKLTLLYSLLAFALAALVIGSLSVLQGIRKERRMVGMKSNFLSAVSHELKTPLTAIRMFAEILESGKQTQEEKRKKYAQLIGQESMRLQRMIEGILNFTRLEESRSALKFEPVDLNSIVQEVAGLILGAFEKANIELILKLEPTTKISGDYDALRSVIQNLVENALKYSNPNTSVTVSLKNSEDKIELHVKDQGIGIASQDLKHIFDKFYRAGDEMTRKTKGSGLGLTIVKQILDTHGAQIKVNSKLKEGTEMVVYFDRGRHA